MRRVSGPRQALRLSALFLLSIGSATLASDKATLQRGLKVHLEVCAACHGIERLKFSDFSRPGGPELTNAEVERLAAGYRVRVGPVAERQATQDDTVPSPFPTAAEARQMFGGMLPVDLGTLGRSNLTDEERRQFLLALLLGYRDPPPGIRLPPDRFYNVGAPGQSTGMPPPLANDMVTYWDQTPATVEQYAADVTAFLVWAARVAGERR